MIEIWRQCDARVSNRCGDRQRFVEPRGSPGFAQREIRIEPKFVPSDIETDVERLVEVRLLLECLRVPRFRAIQIRDVMNKRCRVHGPSSIPQMEEELKERAMGMKEAS